MMMRTVRAGLLLALVIAGGAAHAQAAHRAEVDAKGVMRWADTKEELRLFGANYAIASSSDFRAAGMVGGDRKRMIDEDVAHFARMGWNGMRLAFWGDWQNSDLAGNLIPNEHLDLLDYLISKARERGISILFNPIHTYHAGWPDAMSDSFPGFSAHIDKAKLGTDSAAIAAQVNYIHQVLAHVNPYTGVALKDEPAIVLIEMINEPIHHPEDLAGSVRYINTLVSAVRDAGSKALTVHNVSQDFRIEEAVRQSRVQVGSYGWYPTGLNSGHELRGNYLRGVDDYPALRSPILASWPKVVYEFDTADEQSGEMYPAMARAFRVGGVQLAAMFAYDMLETASRNLGWQTHRLNLVYTPRKAMSAVIAAEVMRRLPSGQSYGAYPQNRTFGPFRVSHEENLSEMVTDEAFLNAGPTQTPAPRPELLRRVAGYGSSPLVRYEGEGTYWLDRVREGVWRLEVYPDAVDVRDPFEAQRRDKIVTRAISRARPMIIHIPDLGETFSAEPVAAGNAATVQAKGARITVRPGVYVLSARGPVDRATLPARIANVGFAEYHAPPLDTLETRVIVTAAPQYVTGRPVEVRARVVSDLQPDSVALWVRPVGRGWFSRFPMQRETAYGWVASIPTDTLREGPQEYVVSVSAGQLTTTYPEAVARNPWAWDFYTGQVWHATVVSPRTPLRLLSPAEDASRMAFTRIGDSGRSGIFRVVTSAVTGEPAFHLELPMTTGADAVDDYTASLVIEDRITARHESIAAATGVRVRLRGVAQGQRLHLSLMESDGTTWTTVVNADSEWVERTIPLSEFTSSRGVLLPLGFPGRWNYWVGPAAGRGGAGDHVRAAQVERLQFSLRPDSRITAKGGQGVEVESVTLVFP
ncbi:MAG: rane of secreted protein [Gemmatimonadetes bacterium]|nr:rane of secreted protein [Gemmatimonadota bacterium]